MKLFFLRTRRTHALVDKKTAVFLSTEEREKSDEKYQKKESYVGVQNALKTLCPDGRVGEMMRRESAQCFLEHDVDEDGNAWGERWMQMQPEPNEDGNGAQRNDTTKEGQPDWLLPDTTTN